MTLRYVFAPGTAREKILTADDDINSHNPVRTHTGLSDLSATIVEDRSLDEYVQRQDRLNVEVDGSVIWTGYPVGLNHDIGQGQSRLRAEGIAKKLKETRPDYESLGGSLTYQSIALEDAIDDYWSRTPFDNYSVTPQSTETVATDEQVQSLSTQSDWESAIQTSDDKPVVVDSGTLTLYQSCFTAEGEDYDRDSGTTSTSLDSEASAGVFAIISGTNGGSFEWDFNLDYIIPEGEFDIQYRIKLATTQNDIVAPFDVFIDGTKIVDNESPTNTDWQWGTLDNPTGAPTYPNTPPQLDPGTHTLKIEMQADSGNDNLGVDVVGPADGRYSYTLDNDNGGSSGYLDGPELYPDVETAIFDPVGVSFNITDARIDSSWVDSNVSSKQAIELSNDNSTFITTNNSQTADVSFSTNGRSLYQRVDLSRYGSRTNNTPQTGFKPQAIDTWDAFVDGNTLVVIDELELSRNHFANLQQLHQYGGSWQWTIEHDGGDIANMSVISYQRGDETRAKPSAFEDPESESAEVQAEAYYNSIYLQGALDDVGNRPAVEVKDEDRIAEDGREISPGVLRDPKATTEAGVAYQARALLESALSNNDLVGSKTLPSDTLVEPGYQYPVNFGEGDKEKTLERISLTESPQDVQIRAKFTTPRSDLSSQIEDLQRKARNQGDKL